jgi:hypothetical protein
MGVVTARFRASKKFLMLLRAAVGLIAEAEAEAEIRVEYRWNQFALYWRRRAKSMPVLE